MSTALWPIIGCRSAPPRRRASRSPITAHSRRNTPVGDFADQGQVSSLGELVGSRRINYVHPALRRQLLVPDIHHLGKHRAPFVQGSCLDHRHSPRA